MSAFVHIIGEDFEMSEVSVKTESDIGSSIYSLTTYTNQSGSYFVNVSAFTSNGVTVGYMIQNVFAPAGKYSFNLTSLSGENYKVWVTLPTGETIDPTMYQFVDDSHGHLGIAWVKPIYCGEPEIPFIPTEQELDNLISAVGKKMACYLQLLKETGARCGEISKLRWTDVDAEQKTVRVKGEKGSYPRMLPISNKAVEMLKNLPKTGERVFADTNAMRTCYYVQRKKVARKLGNPRLQQITFHTFRHWKGTMLYHQTKDVYYVKEYLGHKNLQSTQVYIHIEKAMFRNTEPDEYHVRVVQTKEEITELLEQGFEYVVEKDGLAYFRKRK